MMWVVIGVIAFMFMKKRKNGMLPVEPTKVNVHLATGKNMTVEIKKGQVLIPKAGEETLGVCSVGYKWDSVLEKCVKLISTTGVCPYGYKYSSVLNECIPL